MSQNDTDRNRQQKSGQECPEGIEREERLKEKKNCRMKQINQPGGFCDGPGVREEGDLQLLDPLEQDGSKWKRKYDEGESGRALTP